MTITATEMVSVAEVMVGIVVPIIYECIQKRRLKKNLIRMIKQQVEAVDICNARLVEDVLKIFGACMLGNHLLYSKRQAKEMREELECDYIEMLDQTRELANLIDLHKLDFRDAFGEDWIVIEAFVEIFKSQDPKWELMMKHPAISEKMTEIKTDSMFVATLSSEINDFNDTYNLDLKEFQSLLDISKNKKFWKCINKCIRKSTTPPINVRRPHR